MTPCLLLQTIENRIDLFDREMLVVMPVNGHRRRSGAGSDAFFFALQIHATIGELSPSFTPSFFSQWRRMSSAPLSQHETLVQMAMLLRPTGLVSSIE